MPEQDGPRPEDFVAEHKKSTDDLDEAITDASDARDTAAELSSGHIIEQELDSSLTVESAKAAADDNLALAREDVARQPENYPDTVDQGRAEQAAELIGAVAPRFEIDRNDRSAVEAVDAMDTAFRNALQGLLPIPGNEEGVKIGVNSHVRQGETPEERDTRVSIELGEAYKQFDLFHTGTMTSESDSLNNGRDYYVVREGRRDRIINGTPPSMAETRPSAAPSGIHAEDGEVQAITYTTSNPWGGTLEETHTRGEKGFGVALKLYVRNRQPDL